jgi:hypothetical protein
MMKTKIGFYLSKQTAARLAAAAEQRGASKSALVEAALAAFLSSKEDVDCTSLGGTLSLMSYQLERLDQNIKFVNEIVALQARYQLAVTPPLPPSAVNAACALGSERFDEFVTQVGRRVRSGTSLMQETMDRLCRERDSATQDCGKGRIQISGPVQQADLPTPCPTAANAEHSAAGREGGSLLHFPGKAGIPLH